MSKIISSIVLTAALLSGCSFNSFVSGLTAIETADTAKHILAQYLDGDEKAMAQIAVPLNAIDTILLEVEKVDSGKALYEFVVDNGWMFAKGGEHYRDIVNAVREYRLRSGKEVPKELQIYDESVRYAYADLIEAVQKRDKAITVASYTKLLVKILAAKQGIIL